MRAEARRAGPLLPFDAPPAEPSLPDGDARRAATDPARNVVLEASAGTGKTRVLVERYVNLLKAGVDPENVLAITFTRKAAAEMRQRIVERLVEAKRSSELSAARWRDLKLRIADISVSTIDAFCLSLLREFPLEADVDPGFEIADEAQLPRLLGEALDGAFRICRTLALEDEDVALVFAQLGERRLRDGVAALVDRRLVAPQALERFLSNGPAGITSESACRLAATRLADVFSGMPIDRFLRDGPAAKPQFAMLAEDIRRLCATDRLSLATREDQAAFRNFVDRLRAYFLKQDGKPRGAAFAGTPFTAGDCLTDDAWKRHRHQASTIAPAVAEAIRAFRRDLNVVMSRGVRRMFSIALQQHEQALDTHALLDFAGVLERAVRLLRELDEFSESRLHIESRFRHVLVDEFQDTSRVQWHLVRQLVESWGEGFGAADDTLRPSIFIVGDRKQSIYGFRDAEVALVDEAAAFVESLRPLDLGPLDVGPLDVGLVRSRHAITVSFRSAAPILSFVNDLFGAIVADATGQRADGFRYTKDDRFPMTASGDDPRCLGVVAAETVARTAELVADEIVSLLSRATVSDPTTGVRRPARPADVAILFRSRDSHRDFESAIERRGVPTYVYKGLGFFESDEVQDVIALIRYLADPLSQLRAAAFLRSRIVRLSDPAVLALGPDLAGQIVGEAPRDIASRASRAPGAARAPRAPGEAGGTDGLDPEDQRVLHLLRSAVPTWLEAVDHETPSRLIDTVLRETAYAFELRGARRRQARENLKKLRGMIRRAQNRGYATLSRIADHLDRLAIGDESNAAIDAIDAVNLMTVHAAKGLEFPIVFVVNMGRGTGGVRAPIRVSADASVSIADYQSEADADAAARDREETKRLLYVALTRARERLYLSAAVTEGKCRMGRGSLGEVLPDEVRALFVQATGNSEVIWISPSGGRHVFDSVRTPDVTDGGSASI